MMPDDVDFFPWPPDQDDPRIKRLAAELARVRVELEAVVRRNEELCQELARLQEACPADVLDSVYSEFPAITLDHQLTIDQLIGP
jgi:hypothetical protein